jgi:hypothetical protein
MGPLPEALPTYSEALRRELYEREGVALIGEELSPSPVPMRDLQDMASRKDP